MACPHDAEGHPDGDPSSLAPLGGWPVPDDAALARAFLALGDDAREFYVERVAILIADGGLSEADAQREALRLTARHFGLSG